MSIAAGIRVQDGRAKAIIGTLGAVLLFVVFLAAVKGFQIYKAMSNQFRPPPDAVTSAQAQALTWERTFSAVGSIVATQGVVLSAEEPGKVSKVNFESGAKVEAGTVLVELDTTVEQANLNAARALWEQAQKGLERAKMLRAKNANSQADLDAAIATAHSTEGAADSLRAVIARKKIVAPFSGRTGIRAVNVGQYLSPGTPVVPLYALDPVYLNFSLPQQTVASLQVGSKVRAALDAFPGEHFEGTITTINPQVDPATRNVELQATIPNPSERIRPGMYAQVTLVLPEVENVVAIPASSVTYAPYGDTVYVIEKMKGPDGSEYTGVRQQVVKLGSTKGDLVAVTSGIKAGEEIVTSGGFKLRPNGAVVVNNVVTPGSSTNPTPSDT